MHEHIPEIERAGARVLILGDRVVTNPQLDCYRALGARRGLRSTFDFRGFVALIGALRRGFRQSGVQGDAFQLGGAFPILPDGSMPLALYARYAGDHAEPHELLGRLHELLPQASRED